MNKKRGVWVLSLFLILIVILLSACSPQEIGKIYITQAKMATAIDEKLMPVKVINVFPGGTSKVFCWFQWKNAEVNTTIVAKWHYVTDDIAVLDYTFAIPRKEGSGSVSLSMPEGKALPSGQYSVNLTMGKCILKSLKFEVE